MDTEHDNKIIILPEFEELQKEVALLRVELSMIVLERDELLHVVCKNLEMQYLLELGSYEYQIIDLNCKLEQIKREIELIQMYLNRDEAVDYDYINFKLNEEFAHYTAQLREQMQKMNAALERNNSPLLNAEDSKELKKLYHDIIKKLHPDLHPEITENEKQLFNNAVFAYENGDLQALRTIAMLLLDYKDVDLDADSFATLLKQKEQLSAAIASVQSEIKSVKESYPYNQKKLLEDKVLLQGRKDQLQNSIEKFREAIAYYEYYKTSIIGK